MRNHAVYPFHFVKSNFLEGMALLLIATATSLLVPSPMRGQAATAVIDGTVLDATGAAVPGAEVVVANTHTGFERKVQTNGAGLFTASDLTPGQGYTVTVTKAGFAKFTVNEFDLAIGQALAFPVNLAVANAGSTEVNVTSDAPVIEATKTDVSGVVDSARFWIYPLTGAASTALFFCSPA